jgi:hypothetical protein
MSGDEARTKSPWRAIFESEAPERYLFHYTSLRTAIECILPDRQFPFSRLASMRDPRESRWAFGTAFYGDMEDADALFCPCRAGRRSLPRRHAP